MVSLGSDLLLEMVDAYLISVAEENIRREG